MPLELQRKTLHELYSDNIRRLSNALAFCRDHEISLYRIPSGLFPSSEDGIGAEVLAELGDRLAAVGRRAAKEKLRLVMHPDQFVVLSSEKRDVVDNSVSILSHQARVLDALGLPRSSWAAIQIHGGKGGRADALVEEIEALPPSVRSRLALENDEYTYGAEAILDICRRSGVPMVFDAHHHIVHEKLDSYDDPSVADAMAKARSTWPEPSWQIVHISNGRDSFNDAKHADFIEAMPEAYRDLEWIEVEAKGKENAVAALRKKWPEW